MNPMTEQRILPSPVKLAYPTMLWRGLVSPFRTDRPFHTLAWICHEFGRYLSVVHPHPPNS